MVSNFFLTRSRHVVEKIRSFFCYPEITKNTQAGFTMIEMLTVISIMSLIGSITLARTFEARRLAQDTKVIQDTKSLIKVFQAYYLDHGYFPGLTSAQASSVQNTYSNFGCPSVHICDYSAGTDSTSCDNRRACDCPNLNNPNDPAQRATRRQMGWLPMLDGTFNSQDSYFTPLSTPKDERNINCEPQFPLIGSYKYQTGFSAQANKYIIFYQYFLKKPRKGAPGVLQGCTSTFCAYYFREYNISL